LEIISLTNVDASVSIGKRIVSSELILCKAQAGDTFVAIHPNKFFVSFKSTASNASVFFIQSKYSPKSIGKRFVNEERCSDQGASVNSIPIMDNTPKGPNDQMGDKAASSGDITNFKTKIGLTS